MKVAIDYWPGATHEPGVGRYVREFARALVRLADAPMTTLFDWGPGARLESAERAESLPAGVQLVRRKLPRAWLASLARLGIGPERLAGGCDLLHGAQVALPRPTQALSSLAVSAPPRDAAEVAGRDVLIVFSAHARDALATRLGVDPRRIFEVPVGCEHFSRALPRERPAPSRAPRVLALGRVDRSRAPLELLAACELLADGGEAVELTFLGRVGDAYDELRARATRSRIGSRVRFDSSPDDAKTTAALGSHDVLVQVATDDWTPVTPLEGAACGLELVAARLPAYEQALGALPRWVAPEPAPQELAQALSLALADARARLHAAEQAELASRYSWERNATLTLAAWRTILQRP